MKNVLLSFVVFYLFATNAVAADFPTAPSSAPAVPATAGTALLSAQKFPKTFGDLSFADRMAVLREGYEPFESTFDADGNCISGCPFQGIKLQDMVDYYNQQTAIATARAAAIRAMTPPPPPSAEAMGGKPAPVTTTPFPTETPVPAPLAFPSVPTPETQTSPAELPGTGNDMNIATAPYSPAPGAAAPQTYPSCPVPQPKKTAINPQQTIPDGYPLNGPVTVNSPFGERPAPPTKGGKVGSTHHTGVDLHAPAGTPVFSTLAGTVTFAGPNGACGNMVKVQSRDNFGIGFCHLSKIMVQKGDNVSGGCVVALSGDTGNSGGPHLHYIVYSNGTPVNPDLAGDSFIRK